MKPEDIETGETYMWNGKPVEVKGRSTTRCEVVTDAGRHWHVWARELKPMPLTSATLLPHREQAREFEGVSPLRNLPMRQMLDAVEEMALAGSAVLPEILDGSPPSGLQQQSPPPEDEPKPWTPEDLPDLLSHWEPREDEPSYGGWSEGDVMAYLSRFGGSGNNDGKFFCRRGYFIAWFKWHWGEWLTTVSVDPQVRGHTSHGLRTLPEALRWAVEKWRELVAESDPMPQTLDAPQQPGPTQRHVMTGDLGARTEFGAGWHDPEDK